MSQAGIINVAGGGGGGTPVQTLKGDTGAAAVPVANNINILATDESANNTNGIRSESATPTGDDVTIFLTNRIFGTAQTTDAVTQTDIISFDMGLTPGTYLFNQHILAYNVTSELSASYATFRTVRTDGATAVAVSANPGTVTEETDGLINMEDTSVTSDVTTTPNTYRIYVTGIAGQTINWLVLTTYEFIGA